MVESVKHQIKNVKFKKMPVLLDFGRYIKYDK